jgi:hypothetical protein
MTHKTLLLGMALLGAVCVLNATPPHRAKLLHYGWDMTNPRQLREHWREMEATMPFDGVIFPLTNADGWAASLYMWDGSSWPADVFDSAVKDLQNCDFKRFTDNFAIAWISPGPMDWLDDAGWKNLAAKFGLLAKAAKAAGLKGICFDPEPYQKFNWAYNPECGRTFDEMKVVARSRGRTVMSAMAMEYPDMTFLAFWLLSTFRCRTGQPDPIYGLYPAFIDGLWDAVPPKMTIVDGCEAGYCLRTQSGALRTAQSIRRDFAGFVSPENRERYRRQISAGFGCYLDAYVPPRWFANGDHQVTMTTLFHNMNYLLSSADQYVWFYSEQHQMFSHAAPANAWEATLPGLDKTLRMARHPEDFVEELSRIGAEGAIVNHWPNPEFKMADAQVKPQNTEFATPGTLPPGYSAWFPGEEDASLAKVVDGKIELQNGICLIVGISVTGGSVYSVTVPFHGDAAAFLQGRIGFQNASSAWIEQEDAMYEMKDEKADDRRLHLLIGPVPDSATKMLVLVNRGGPGNLGPVSIDHPTAYCLDDLLPKVK